MLDAIAKGRKITAREARYRGVRLGYLCPECRATVGLRRGPERVPHFAHLPNSGVACKRYNSVFGSGIAPRPQRERSVSYKPVKFLTDCKCGLPIVLLRGRDGVWDVMNRSWPWTEHICEVDFQSLLDHAYDLLAEAGFTHDNYRMKLKRSPRNSDRAWEVAGFVVNKGRIQRSPLRQYGGEGLLQYVAICDMAGRRLTTCFPKPIAEQLEIFDGVKMTLKPMWLANKLCLIATRAEFDQPISYDLRPPELIRSQGMRCRYCHRHVGRFAGFGFDSEFELECSECHDIRRDMAPTAFISFCHVVASRTRRRR